MEDKAVFLAALRARGWRFYTFIGGGARFMFAWDADPAGMERLPLDIRAASVSVAARPN